MNLLPYKITRQRQIYAECKKLAAVQAVIFLLFVLIVMIFQGVIVFRERGIEERRMQILDERYIESEAIARAIKDHHENVAAQYLAMEWLELPVFNTERLLMVKETLPAGVSLIHIDIGERTAILTALTENLSLADVHRDAWMSTGLVSRVQLSSAAVTEEGAVRYVLALYWK